MPLDAFVGAVVSEFSRLELASIICGIRCAAPKACGHSPLSRLDLLDGVCSCSFYWNWQDRPHEARRGIHQKQEVALVASHDRATQVVVDELQIRLAGAEHRDVVDAVEHPVLAGLGLEHDGANATNLHRGRIPKLDGASDTAVQVGKELLAPSHVMHGAAVEVPPYELVVAEVNAKEDSRARLVDLESSIHQRGMRMRKIEAFAFPLPSSVSSSRQPWAKN